MPDWEKIVRERIGSLRLSSATRNEVIKELATHLQDEYERIAGEGLTENAAVELALSHSVDWATLRVQIEQARKDTMNDRTRKVMLPGAVCFALVMFSNLLLSQFQQPRIIRINEFGFIAFSVLSLVVAYVAGGAIGAYLSRRAGGSIAQRVMAAEFPSIITLVVILLTLVLVLVASVVTRKSMAGFYAVFSALFGHVVGAVLLPGVMSLAGALPFLWEWRRSSAEA